MGFKKFLMFLVVVVVSISLGMTVWYFVRDDEVISINERPVYLNVGDVLTLKDLDFAISHKNENTVIDFVSNSDSIDEYIEFIQRENTLDCFYEAKKGGSVSIEIATSNKRYPLFSISIEIGDGSKTNPFIIDSENDLASIGVLSSRPLSSHYRLAENLVLTKEFVPIGYKDGIYNTFNGSFNGGANTLTGLKIENDYNFAGLFARLGESAVVSNLNILNADISGEFDNVGAVAGLSDGWINGVTVSNAVIENYGLGKNSGLVAGKTTANSMLSRTSAVGELNGNGNVGGLIGYFDGSAMRACWVDALLNNTGSLYTGGLVGYMANESDSWIAECYSISVITSSASAKTGGLLGYYPTGGDANLYGLYYNSERTSQSAIGQGSNNTSCAINSATTAQLQTKTTYKLYLNISTALYQSWDFSSMWYMANNGMYPIIRQGDSKIDKVVIETPSTPDPEDDENIEDDDIVIVDEVNASEWLENVRANPDKIYILTADIDFEGQTINPIENFFGALYSSEGNQFSIKNFKISASATNMGLFGKLTRKTTGSAGIYSGIIRDVSFEDITITSKTGTTQEILGSIIGIAEKGTYLYNINLTNININASANQLGGFVGEIRSGAYVSGITINESTIVNTNTNFSFTAGLCAINNGVIGYVDKNTNEIALTSLNSVAVKGIGIVGGVVASNTGNIRSIEINNSTNKEIQLETNKTNNYCAAGAIAGISSGLIIDSKVSAFITGSRIAGNAFEMSIGGAVGVNSGTLKTIIMVEGKVSAVATKLNIGGIAGKNTGDIETCLNSFEVNGGYADMQTYTGGIVGLNNGLIYRNINLGNIQGSYAGGIAGNNLATDFISSISFDKLRNIKTGVIKECYSSGINPAAFTAYIADSLRNDITGIVVGGIAGKMDYGYIANSFAISNLKGNSEQTLVPGTNVKVAGLVGLLDGTPSKYGLVETCISSCTYNDGGVKKFDTVSPVYEGPFLPGIFDETAIRKTGTILNCIADKSLNLAIEISYAFSSTKSGNNNSGSIFYRLSSAEATSNHTVYHQILDTSIWKITGGGYPSIKIFTTENCPQYLKDYLDILNEEAVEL